VDLLQQWEEQRQQRCQITVAELCPDDPALQEALRQRSAGRERFRPFWTAPR
jgi:hypothetical protein